MSDIPGWEDPRRVLSRHGLAPKRRYSQNFLVSRHAVERIADALAPTENEQTVELGPGLGTLTGELLRRGARVLAVDQDPQMLEVLREELGHIERLELVAGDAAAFDLAALSAERGPLAVAGNLPYAITGAILRNLTHQRAAISRAVIMVQREVADRLAASPGSKRYGAVTVFVQAAFDVSRVVRVPAGAFHPAPKVDSSVVSLQPPPVPRANETPAFRSVVKAAFGQRRKTLRNSLRALPGGAAALEAAEVDPSRRAETLTVEELARVAQHLESGDA